GQLTTAALGDLLVALVDHLGANLQGDALDVASADRHAGEFQREGGVGEGRQTGGGLGNHLYHGGAIAAAVQTQVGPEGGKSPGGSRDSGRSAREGGLAPPSRPESCPRRRRDRGVHSLDRRAAQAGTGLAGRARW